MKKDLRFSEKEEDQCKEVERLVQSLLSHPSGNYSLSPLAIYLFLEKMISKNKDCILLCVFCNLVEKFAQSFFHSAFVSLTGFVLESLSLSLCVCVCVCVSFCVCLVARKVWEAIFVFLNTQLQIEREIYYVHFKLQIAQCCSCRYLDLIV